MHLVYSIVKVRNHGRTRGSSASGWLYDLRKLNNPRVIEILGFVAGRLGRRSRQAPFRAPVRGPRPGQGWPDKERIKHARRGRAGPLTPAFGALSR
jgi:hypothetical protein